MKLNYFPSIVYLFCLVIFCCCGNNVDPCKDHPCTPCNSSSEISLRFNQLNEIYEDNCIPCLEDFFSQWAENYPPMESIPDSAVWLYDLFAKIYTPDNLTSFVEIDDPNLVPGLYDNTQFYVVHDKVTLRLGDIDSDAMILEDFRPPIANNSIIPLYSRPEFTEAIACFLDNSLPFGEKPSHISDNEKVKRVRFIENFIKLTPRSWSIWDELGKSYIFGEPIIETHPFINEIFVSEDNDSATIKFIISTWQFKAKFKRSNSDWEVYDYLIEWDGSYL